MPPHPRGEKLWYSLDAKRREFQWLHRPGGGVINTYPYKEYNFPYQVTIIYYQKVLPV